MRIAAIDIGTNTVLLLVAERVPSGILKAIEERATITRLGEGVDRTRAFTAGAIERTLRCLDDYARVVANAGVDRVLVVGTSAMRDAMGGEVLREQIVRLFGEEPRVVSGAEEARLSFVGSLSGLSGVGDGTGDEVGMFDIGGGSTEVVIGKRLPGAAPVISFARSFDIGSVRLTERLCSADPPQPAELAAIRTTAREIFRDVPPLPGANAPVGVAGTMTTLAAVQLGLTPYDGARVHGLKLSAAALATTVSQVAKLDTRTRASVPGMEPKRADVIVAGGLIAVELLEHWRAREVIISDRGVRWGLLEEFARAAEPLERPQRG